MLLPFFAQAQVTATITSTNVTCFGLCNGSATVTGSGGWAPYTYLWSTGATSATITGLCAGTYTVTVTDIDQGTGAATVIIMQPTQLGVTVNAQQQQLCGVAPDGQASVTPYGGTPPYTYLWNDPAGSTTPQITGLSAGTYTVTVTDANNCTAVGSSVITFSPEGIWVIDSTEDITCFGLNNGFIHIGVMTGTPPYTYMWTGNVGGQTGPNIFNLGPGVYSVTVTDANGCTNLHTVTITSPPQLVVSMVMTDALCGLPGTATVTPSGGTPPYSVMWSTGSTSFTITAPAGTYSVTVKDANQCSVAKTVIIGGNNTGLTVNVTVLTSAGCVAGGSATATASGGSGNYAYFWDNGETTATAINLTAGTIHKVTVTDITTGCMGIGMVTIPSASSLVLVVVVSSNATCATGGTATVTASGGTPPYTYAWDNGQMVATATGLMAGVHTVTVHDAGGCIATASVTITQSQGPTVTIQVVSNATCTAGGSATATATGGTAPYTYLWDNGQTGPTATNLSPGPHKVVVTDAAGCSSMATVTITQPGAPTAIISASTPAPCNGSGGSATVTASGGTPPYTYKWSNGGMSMVATGLPAGSYTVTVTDNAGCTATATISVAAAIPPNVVITASSNAKCDQPGSATASANGGTGTYTYKWDNGEMTATAVNLAAGVHTVTVTDAAGCTATASVTIGFAANGIKLGDFVFYDSDQNGRQGAAEPGVPNVTVMLIKPGPDGIFGNADDVIVQSTTTNSSGKYEFLCVTPGTYVIMFSGIPAGYEYTLKDQGPGDCLDSDAGTNGKTDPYTVVAGQNDYLCLDAGIHTICNNVLSAGLICCDQTICEGQVPATLVGVVPPSGGSGPIEYQWIQLLNLGPAGPAWVGIPGATGPTYQPGPLFETSYFMRCARRAGCPFLESNMITITVIPAGTGNCPTFIMNIHALQQGPSSVLVEWETLPEGDSYMYTVEHSSNQTLWTGVSSPIMGKHDAVNNNHYAVMDNIPDNGINYYRVKRANANGTEVYSRTVQVEMNMQLSIKPNPVSDKLHIDNLTVMNSDVTIQLVSLQGRLLRSVVVKAGALQHVEIDMADLPEGLYIARLDFGNGRTQTLKITKF